jgi:hypothetical protein
MRVRKWLIACVCLLLILPLLGWLWQQLGPRGPVPTVDPIVRWNAEHAQLEDNAADLYHAAFERLVGKKHPAWREMHRLPSAPVPPESAAWVEQNQDALELARQAAQRRHCWFVLERNPNGDLNPSHLSHMRALAKLLHWRILVAVQQHDAATLVDSATTIDRIARHAHESAPDLVNSVMATSMKAMALDTVLQPMLWPEMSPADRAAYLAGLAPIFEPPPPLTSVLAGKQELDLWMYAAGPAVPWQMRFLAAPARVAGELERYFHPFRELAGVPVEQACDPGNPLVGQVHALENEPITKWNIPRMFAHILLPSMSRVLFLRARFIAEQRGAHTVLELFAYHDRTGARPDSLEALAGDFKIDPFSGKPFIYCRTDDGFTLYSVGVDRQDNGGRHDPRFGEDRTDSDYVIWPIPERQATSAPAPSPEQLPK